MTCYSLCKKRLQYMYESVYTRAIPENREKHKTLNRENTHLKTQNKTFTLLYIGAAATVSSFIP